jgi:hypothetical protein
MYKMSLHDPFEHLKHKLWPKKGPKVKLSIWFSTIKSLESPWFTCVKVACHIMLESSWSRLRLCFKSHLNQRFPQEIIGLQSCESPNFKNFGTPNLGIPGQNDIWVLAPWLGIENIIKGKVVASPKSGPWWILWVCVCLWVIRAPKVFQLCSNQLVVWFMQVYVSNWCTCHSS